LSSALPRINGMTMRPVSKPLKPNANLGNDIKQNTTTTPQPPATGCYDR